MPTVGNAYMKHQVLLPLIASDRLGDGALLLAIAALLALLFVVREAVNLAAARSELESMGFKFQRSLEFLPWQHIIFFSSGK